MPEFDSFDQAAAHLLAISADRQAATRRATAAAAHHMERHVKLQLSRSSHRRGTPTPSAPGQPPSLVSGTLRRSTRTSGPRRYGRAGWEATVGPTAVYGEIQEKGGRAGRGLRSELPARPYVGPGVRAALPGVRTLYRDAWR